MQPIRRISAPTPDRRGGSDNRVCVRFELNREPEETWIRLFKAHAASSVLNATNAIISGSAVAIEVAKPTGDAELATALDCFIECANLRLRSFPSEVSQRKPAAAQERARLRGQRV